MNKQILKAMRRVYTNRLLEALSETDLIDKEGNILVSKDLKIRHKESGYEYTVDDIVSDSGGNVELVLRAPEDPRFEPAHGEEILMATSPHSSRRRKERDLHPDDLEIPPEEGELFVIDQESFEKEYEVK